jgi:hypothetical protein
MTASQWLGAAILVCIGLAAFLMFRRSSGVKPSGDRHDLDVGGGGSRSDGDGPGP